MLLIIGGSYAGKTAFARHLPGFAGAAFADGRSAGFEEIYNTRALLHFEDYVRRALREMGEPFLLTLPEEIIRKNPDLLLIGAEIGCGIVPLSQEERSYREAYGRVMTGLAGKASRVYRVVAGIGTLIREEKES